MSSVSVSSPSDVNIDEIVSHCDQYKGADTSRSVFQLVTTLTLFAALLVVMHLLSGISYWLTALLILPAAGVLTRLFIFQHDCGHQSFFNSRKANDWVGRCLGVLTFTPYDFWRRSHNMHHANSGDLDNRGLGAIDTITVAEYNALSPLNQFLYRVYRNPVVMLFIGTPLSVIVAQRFPADMADAHFFEGCRGLPFKVIWPSVAYTNLSIILFFGALYFIFGGAFLLTIYLPVLVVTCWIGGWLFYIQHQFEDAYWQNNKEWCFKRASLLGSSYYELPKILQWFSGSIGLHHIHHLCSKIPNYKLQECMDALPELQDINRMSLKDSLSCLRFKLWDEQGQRMVDFSDLKKT